MKKQITLLSLALLSVSLLAGCGGDDKEHNQTDLTAKQSFFADAGQANLVFTLANATLSSSVDASKIELSIGFSTLKITKFVRDSDTSFSLSLSGKCKEGSNNLGIITLLGEGTVENKYDYLVSFNIVNDLIFEYSFSSSSSTIGTVSYTSKAKSYALYNGASWLSADTTNVTFTTSDETNHPLSALTETTVLLNKLTGYVDITYTYASDTDISAFKLNFLSTTNDFGCASSFTL